MALQIRRGTDAERQLITPLQGELIFTTDTNRLYVGDGTTLGGVAVDTAGTGGGASVLNDLTDVTISGLTTGQVLKWNGTAWVNGTDEVGSGTTISSINDIPDVSITTPVSGQVLKFNGSAWVNDTDLNDGNGAIALGDITDVDIVTPLAGQVLKFDGFNWVNGTDENLTSLTISDLTDTSISSLVEGNSLIWNGLDWVNSFVSLDSLLDVNILTPQLNDIIYFDGLNWSNKQLSLEDAADVIVSNVLENEYLKWDGSSWANSILSIQDDLLPALGGDLSLNNFNIQGSGNISISGSISNSVVNITNDSITSSSGFITLGSEENSADITAYLNGRLRVYGIASVTGTGGAFIKLRQQRGTFSSPLRVEVNDWLGGLEFSAYADTDTVAETGLVFMQNDGTNWPLDSNYISSRFVVVPTTNTGYSSRILTFDKNGILSTSVWRSSGLSSTDIASLTPTNGMIVYNTTTNKFQGYQNGAWINLDGTPI
jgi:hypothetical protein